MGIHPTYSLEAVSHLALREKLFKYILKKRVLSYAASSDPPWGQPKPVRAAPTHKCPECGELLYTAEGLHLHRLRKHKDTYKTGVGIRQPKGIPIRYKLSENAPVPQKNQAKSWITCNSNFCPSCSRKFPSIALCRKHWSSTCSNPLAKKCPGCQLMIKTAAKASWPLDFTKKLSPNYAKLLVPAKIRRQAWPLHTCLKDPAKAPPHMRMALKQFKHGRLTGRKSGRDTRAVRRGRLTFAKPKQVAAAEPLPAQQVKEAPRPLYYQLLPLATIRRHIRAPFRDRGKSVQYNKPHRRLRDTRYKPLPDDWLWPQPPHYPSLPYQKPTKKKKKKGIPQWVLDEWKLFDRQPKANKTSSSSNDPPPQPSWLEEARDPGTGELDSRPRTLSEDSADDEAFTCLDPFEHNWDELALGLDDPA